MIYPLSLVKTDPKRKTQNRRQEDWAKVKIMNIDMITWCEKFIIFTCHIQELFDAYIEKVMIFKNCLKVVVPQNLKFLKVSFWRYNIDLFFLYRMLSFDVEVSNFEAKTGSVSKQMLSDP